MSKISKSLSIKEIEKIDSSIIIDVRCPREYVKGHVTNAINIPIFNNQQYKELGILYKNIFLKMHVFAWNIL